MNEPAPSLEQGAAQVGGVVIGRNEGERLRRCLDSLKGLCSPIIYVDSGSSDGSVDLAGTLGAVVVELDRTLPFTAARARNVGFAKLREIRPDIELVQFVDGDCEVVPGWLEHSLAKLRADSGVAVVCGRRRERHPDVSVYNRLCDLEWNTPVGEATACGGDALMRAQPLVDVGGFNPSLIAGEEPDLCLRLRQRGHRIWRLDTEMTLHDANITRLGQWVRRTLRSGYACAEAFTLHRKEPGAYYRKQMISNFVWGAALPITALGLAVPTGGMSLLLLCGYAVLGFRIFAASRRAGQPAAGARMYALFCVLGKIPSAYGQLSYWVGSLFGNRSTIIEYKGVGR